MSLADEFAEASPGDAELLRRQVRSLTKEVATLEADLLTVSTIKNHDGRIPKWTSRKPKKSAPMEGVPVLLLSDWHWGEHVDARDMDGFNAYDDTIALTRWERVINETPEALARHAHGYGFPWMVMALLGDMVSGDIHEELARTNTLTPPEAMVEWVPRIVAGLRYVADELGLEKVVVPCVDGNHDRLDKKKAMKARAVRSFTWAIYHWVADQLADDDRFHFLISRSSDVRLPIYDEAHLFVHGDDTRGGGGIGGIWPPIMRYVAKTKNNYTALGKPVDLVAMGHWHQYVVGHGWVVNGSGKGYDEYARRSGFAPERPQQALYLVTPDRGVVLHTAIHAE